MKTWVEVALGHGLARRASDGARAGHRASRPRLLTLRDRAGRIGPQPPTGSPWSGPFRMISGAESPTSTTK